MSAPIASGAGIAASTLSPAASYEIGQYFKGKDAEGSAAHILAHTILVQQLPQQVVIMP